MKNFKSLALQLRNQLNTFNITMERAKGHKPDVSTEQAMVENRRALHNRLQARYKQVIFAENRAKEGLYGICIQCGNRINSKRLEILPETCVCVDGLLESLKGDIYAYL